MINNIDCTLFFILVCGLFIIAEGTSTSPNSTLSNSTSPTNSVSSLETSAYPSSNTSNVTADSTTTKTNVTSEPTTINYTQTTDSPSAITTSNEKSTSELNTNNHSQTTIKLSNITTSKEMSTSELNTTSEFTTTSELTSTSELTTTSELTSTSELKSEETTDIGSNPTHDFTNTSTTVVSTEKETPTETSSEKAGTDFTTEAPTSTTASTFPTPELAGKDAKFEFTLVLQHNCTRDLSNKSSADYRNYTVYFTKTLIDRFYNMPGLKYVGIKELSNDGTRVNYNIVADAECVKYHAYEVEEYLNFTVGNWTGFKVDLWYGKVNETATEEEFETQKKEAVEMLHNRCKLISDPCEIGHNCINETCIPKCHHDDCGHGACYFIYPSTETVCRCDFLYSGDKCDQKKGISNAEKLLIIEIAGGAGGGVILFLLIVLICVCVNLRKKDQNESDTKYQDKEPLKINEDKQAPFITDGKSNPVFNEEVEGDRYPIIPRSSIGMADQGGRYTYHKEEMKRYENFTSQREEPGRNMVRSEDGRIYHVINDEEMGNYTYLYRPSTRHAEEPKWSRGQDRNIDNSNSEARSTYYDRIDTESEYKIERPRINTRQTNYK